MNWIITFEVENNQEEYVKCLQAIEIIDGRKGNKDIEPMFLEKIKLISDERTLKFENIAEKNLGYYADSLPVLKPDDQVTYLFHVNCERENDIVNFIYYFLLIDSVKSNSILCIRCQEKQRANIRDLFSELLDTEVLRECYTHIGEKYERLKLDRIRKTKQFSPIYRIDGESESVEFWRQSMWTFLLQLYRKVQIGGKDEQRPNYTIDYFLPHVCPAKLKEKYSEDKWKVVRGKQKEIFRKQHILEVFVEYFCTGNVGRKSVPIDFVEKRYEWWKSRRLFELVKDMSLLAMYIFCVSDYFQRDIEHDSWEMIEQEIFDARDMADGVQQILENIYHSENKRGYFCFRIHSNSGERSAQYLNKMYCNYMKKWNGKEKDPQSYLEIKVADFSHYTVCERFYLDFKERMEQAGAKEKMIYQRLLPQVKEIKLSSFFNFSDFWSQYNTISENMVHHYGLQIFESLVSCYDGFFQVRSQNTEQLCEETEFYSSYLMELTPFQNAIPGTQYDILIPFQKQIRMQNISLDVNIDYTDELRAEYIAYEGIEFTTKYCTDIYNQLKKEDDSSKLSYQERKERVIRILSDQLKQKMRGVSADSGVIHFSAEKIALTMIELFCKAIMLYIAQKPVNEKCYIMITECTQSHFVEITRMMALFYNKQGENPLMQNTQIFMSGKTEGEEFLITGSNLGEAIGSTEKLAFARCIHPYCLKILKKMLKNHKVGIEPNDIVKIVPFDMINYGSDKGTLFERSVQQVLYEDIQSERFGCKLDKLHVRIGSKIHVRTFYEAELLFHNNYYTSRFAYWLFTEIRNNPELDMDSPFVLVGYENYSEMLLNELCNMFNKVGIKTECLIYEERITGKFRGRSLLEDYKDHQFVIIVPINSTLTTHIKISGFLKKAIEETLENPYEFRTVVNYGIVLISSEKEDIQKVYWKRLDGDKHTVVSNISQEKMKFYIEVFSKWEHPLSCNACFPKEDYTKEVPLVETSKESVVPMHAINIRKKWSDGLRNEVEEDEGNRLVELSKFLVYKHIERNGNHFSYYFSTERLWEFPEIRKNIQKWLKCKKKELFGSEKYKVYDIIVAPLHYSNTAFVEEVNEYLFSNAALVLHFDVDKEFRMNVKTKYSSVQQLYDNLCTDGEKSIINYHYVDDTVISGATFHRMRSLICSLIEQRKEVNVEVNIFKSVVLLMNRMSGYSIRDYIADKKYFIAYFNLKISSMRVNSDACVLCKKYGEWSKLAQQASLNTIYTYWKDKSDKIKCNSVEKIGSYEKVESDKQKRAVQYMMASHNAKSLLDRICDYGDIKYIQEMIVDKLFPSDVSQSPEELIAMLKALGRPFLTFRKEAKEAVFELMLVMIDVLLIDDKPTEDGKLYALLGQIWEKTENRILLVEMLMNRLAELESNYIIRKESMYRILKFSIDIIVDEAERQDFVNNYLNRVKQLVGQSNDFAKGLFLEYLLLYGDEYQEDSLNRTVVSLAGETPEKVFKRKAYLENTKLVDYGIEYLAEIFSRYKDVSSERLKSALNENYYFDNFIQYLAFHQVVTTDENDKVKDFISDVEKEKIWGMVRFEMLYQGIFKERDNRESVKEEELKDEFTDMMECLRDASGAFDGEIIVPYKNILDDKKYIALELRKSAELKGLENNEYNLREFMKQNSDFEDDTYKICDFEDVTHKKYKWILLKFNDNNSFGSENISVIYLLFPFKIQDEGEIVHSLKNLLIFRQKIWRILNLSSGTLLQNWTDNLFYKQQMLKSRAIGHSELEENMRQLEKCSDYICSEKFNNVIGLELEFYERYFELLVNSMIGFMNAQVLGNRGTHYMNQMDRRFMDFWNGEKDVNDAVSAIWKLEIVIEKQEHLKNYKIRYGIGQNNEKEVCPEFKVLRVLFLTIFHNVWKHGKRDGNQICKVLIYEENEQLCVSNCVDEANKKKILKEIDPEAYRSGKGISQAVIFDICQSWYHDTQYDKMFDIENKENDDTVEWFYVVKLPIIERR